MAGQIGFQRAGGFSAVGPTRGFTRASRDFYLPHGQQESARFVTQELDGDYIFGLKGNQSGILERAQSKLPQRFFSPVNTIRVGGRSLDDWNAGASSGWP